MDILQEPKYDAVDGKLVNRATGVAIPDDEYVFVLRAKDVYARQVLALYADIVPSSEHRAAIMARHEQFVQFAKQHPERMKEPDTKPIEALPVSEEPQ